VDQLEKDRDRDRLKRELDDQSQLNLPKKSHVDAIIDRPLERTYEPRYHTSARHYPRFTGSNGTSSVAVEREQDLPKTTTVKPNADPDHLETSSHKPRESDQPQREPPLRTPQTRYNSSLADMEPARRSEREESVENIPATRTLRHQQERPNSRTRQRETETAPHRSYFDHERERRYLRERDRVKPEETVKYDRERDYLPSRERRERRERTNRPKIDYVTAA
jgi:hypothetical protein